ncbi:signal-transducing adaptor protein 1-like [Clarias gariepinus]|uniref:signal-transducing adaptor protein 1-like n=1 Tax=Clarias gariepinus TaxID=13013 RepID=UPI00234C06DF|nr:signal-transducing adaptor protein 1-like [Clarias gariepinus]
MRRAQRIRAQLPSCYYEGFLEKRSLKNRTSQNLWAALCGDALFFFNNSKDCDYVEKQELSNFISLTDYPSSDVSLHLRVQDDDIYLTAPSLEARELWKGFIWSVVKLQVPTSLNLLPGQVRMLKDAVEKENERLKEIAEKAAAEQASKAAATPDHNDYMSVLSEMPACFCKLARIETENLLEKHKDKGNLLLRPSRDGTCFAVTTRQEFNGPVFQHYRVTQTPDGGFVIAVDNPIPCKTLHDVINYLIETTGGYYKPLVLEHKYDENIDYDEENREKRMCCASSSPMRPKLGLKPAPGKKHEIIYQNSFEEDNNFVDEDDCALPPLFPRAPARPPKPQSSVPSLPIGPGGALLPRNFRRHSDTAVAEARPRRPISAVSIGETFFQSRPPKPQSSVPSLPIGPGGALLPPISHLCSATAVAEARPRRPIPAVPIGETLFQCFNKELKQKMEEMRLTAE